jgi:hypothetical protein
MKNNMKTVEIDGRTLQYETIEVFRCRGEGGGSWYKTTFYEGSQRFKKSNFWGKSYDCEVPKELFYIDGHPDNPRLPRQWWRERILEELAVFEREKEIQRGEFI